MRKGKRRLIITAIILVPLLVVFCFWAFVDAPPPNDADLLITYDPVPDDQNAFTYFYEASLSMYRPESYEEKDRARDLLMEGRWDDELASMLVEKNAAVFDLVAKGVSCPHYQIPENMARHEQTDYLDRLREIGRLAAIRSELLHRQGKEQEALDEAITIARLGVQLQDGPGGFTAFLCGTAVIEMGMQRIRRLLADSTLGPEALRETIAQLNDCYANEEGIIEGLKIEYTAAARIVDDITAGRDSFFRPFARESPWIFRLMDLKPNKTKCLFAHTVRRVIADVRLPYARATSPSLPVWRDDDVTYLKALASGNGKGVILHGTLTRGWCYFCRHKCPSKCSVGATQLLLALKCYQLEHGELPDTLSALVPDYLCLLYTSPSPRD